MLMMAATTFISPRRPTTCRAPSPRSFPFPISWTTNYFHFIALTYSPTNTALYLDGVLATNGPGVTVYPGPDVLTNGFIIGSDNNGALSGQWHVQYGGDLQLSAQFQ